MALKYLHTMVRVKDLETSQAFYELLGLKKTRQVYTSSYVSSSKEDHREGDLLSVLLQGLKSVSFIKLSDIYLVVLNPMTL